MCPSRQPAVLLDVILCVVFGRARLRVGARACMLVRACADLCSCARVLVYFGVCVCVCVCVCELVRVCLCAIARV